MTEHRETPIRRVNPSGEIRWVARYTAADGRRRVAGTFKLKREAQAAINAAYRTRDPGATVGAYAAAWLAEHPRPERTAESYAGRLRAVLDVPIEGRRLGDWPLMEFRPRQVNRLLDVLLRDQGRAATGAKGILLVLSAMFSDARGDDLAEMNPFLGMRVRASDPRVRKPPRALRVWSWEDMHRFAGACGRYEPLVRVLSDCGLRIGEAFPLLRSDVHDGVLEVRRTAWRGVVTGGTKTDHGAAGAGRVVPLTVELEGLLRAVPPRLDTPLLFAKARGHMFHGREFYRDVWQPAREATGLDATPHEFRHSWVSRMRAAAIDAAALAAASGHTVETATAYYVHAVDEPAWFEAMRKAVGS